MRQTKVRVPREGIDPCYCGSKYWDLVTVKYHEHNLDGSWSEEDKDEYRCHSCGETFGVVIIAKDGEIPVQPEWATLLLQEWEAAK